MPDTGVTNSRNVASPQSRRWLGIANRFPVPATSGRDAVLMTSVLMLAAALGLGVIAAHLASWCESQGGFVVSNDAHLAPLSVPAADIDAWLNASPYSSGIRFKSTLLTQVGPTATIADVRAAGLASGHMRMLMTGQGLVPVVAHVRDALLLPDVSPAAPIVRPAHVFDPSTPVYEALSRMRAASVQLVVVMEDDRLLGVISLSDIVRRVLPTGKIAKSASAAALA